MTSSILSSDPCVLYRPETILLTLAKFHRPEKWAKCPCSEVTDRGSFGFKMSATRNFSLVQISLV